jgi:hypothetical protein
MRPNCRRTLTFAIKPQARNFCLRISFDEGTNCHLAGKFGPQRNYLRLGTRLCLVDHRSGFHVFTTLEISVSLNPKQCAQKSVRRQK